MVGACIEMVRQGIISAATAERMVKAAGFRNVAVHEYQELDWNIVKVFLTKHFDDFVRYAREVEAALHKPKPPGGGAEVECRTGEVRSQKRCMGNEPKMADDQCCRTRRPAPLAARAAGGLAVALLRHGRLAQRGLRRPKAADLQPRFARRTCSAALRHGRGASAPLAACLWQADAQLRYACSGRRPPDAMHEHRNPLLGTVRHLYQ